MNIRVNTLLKLYILALPLLIIGIEINGYNMTFGTFLAVLLTISAIISGRKFRYFQILPLIFFVLWAASSSMLRHPITSYAPSLISFILMSIPFFVIYKRKDLIGIEKYVKYGFFLTIPFVVYDLLVTVVGLTPLESLNIPFFIHSRSDWFFGVYRVKGTFEEPSHFAIYLVTIYYYLNKKGLSNISINSLLIICIVSTLSLTGSILFLVAYVCLNLLSYKHYLYSLVFGLSLILIFPQYVQNVTNRAIQTVDVLRTTELVGSLGSRINSFDPVTRYYDQEGLAGLTIGVGYGNESQWLINEYQFYENRRISFVRGQITNSFAAFTLSTGLIGVSLYFMIFFLPLLTRSLTLGDFLLIVLIQFAFAVVVGYLFWVLMLIIKLSNK